MKKGGQPTGTLPYLPFKRALFACEDILQLGEKALAFGAFVAGLGFTEEFEQLALAGRQLGRRLDLDLHDQVAGAAPLQNGHAGPALAELTADGFVPGEDVAVATIGFLVMLPISAAFIGTTMQGFSRLMLFPSWI